MSTTTQQPKHRLRIIRDIEGIRKKQISGSLTPVEALAAIYELVDHRVAGRPIETKTQKVEELILGGMPPSKAAREAEVSESVAYRARNRLIQNGKLKAKT